MELHIKDRGNDEKFGEALKQLADDIEAGNEGLLEEYGPWASSIHELAVRTPLDEIGSLRDADRYIFGTVDLEDVSNPGDVYSSVVGILSLAERDLDHLDLGKVVDIRRLMIWPDEQGEGYGKKLAHLAAPEVLDMAGEVGADKLYTEVVHNSGPLQKFNEYFVCRDKNTLEEAREEFSNKGASNKLIGIYEELYQAEVSSNSLEEAEAKAERILDEEFPGTGLDHENVASKRIVESFGFEVVGENSVRTEYMLDISNYMGF